MSTLIDNPSALAPFKSGALVEAKAKGQTLKDRVVGFKIQKGETLVTVHFENGGVHSLSPKKLQCVEHDPIMEKFAPNIAVIGTFKQAGELAGHVDDITMKNGTTQIAVMFADGRLREVAPENLKIIS